MRRIKGCFLAIAVACWSPAWAAPPSAPDAEQAASQATIAKLNPYVELMNRTLRAADSLARYASWVDMRTGPTGRESIIYGLYSLYDVRGEIAKAEAATAAAPAIPDLDAEIKAYIAAYQALAPTVTTAEGYYERQDYRADKMAEGKALHSKLAAAGPVFLAERDKVEGLLKREKTKSDAAELAAIDKREGHKMRWQVTNVLLQARRVMDELPTEKKPVIPIAGFDAALADFAAAVKSMDQYGADNPGALGVFESSPQSLVGKLREFRDKLARAKGDVRRGGARDLTWIVDSYNSMISSGETALQLAR